MAVNPIDLQTLYVQMHQPGKDQAHSRQSVAAAQDLSARKIVQEDDAKTHSVTKAAGTDDQMGIKKDKNAKPGNHPSGEKNRDKDPEEAPPEEKNRFEDPELGKHIDISG